jgi:chitinase
LVALRAAFTPHGLKLSVTMAAWQRLDREAFDAVDAVQAMAYDHDDRHATLDGAKADVEKLLAAGAPPGKLVLGLPFYGRHRTDRQRAMTYGEVVKKWKPTPDQDEHEGIYFNGPTTICRKTEYAVKKKLAGVMMWELGQDATGEDSLLDVIVRSVGNKK